MRRREFIRLIGGVAAWPFVAGAQQQEMPVIGFLGSGSPDRISGRLRWIHEGLSETGYVEGKNVAIEFRWAEGRNDRLPEMAVDLVRRRVTVIFCGGIPAAVAARTATATIPIVFLTASDPIAAGLAATLSRPGGNLTGVTMLGVQIGPKHFELLREMIPTATSIGLLVNPTNPSLAQPLMRDAQATAHSLGLRLLVLYASTASDLDTAFATLAQVRADGLVISPDSFFTNQSELLAELAARHAVPAIHAHREFSEAGGLMSYGGSLGDAFRLVGGYIGRILKGEKPAELPVQQSTKVEFVVNLKTAKALGLTVPRTLLALADEVIE